MSQRQTVTAENKPSENRLPKIDIKDSTTEPIPQSVRKGRTSKWQYLLTSTLPKMKPKQYASFIVSNQNEISTLRQSVKRMKGYSLSTISLGEGNGIRVSILKE